MAGKIKYVVIRHGSTKLNAGPGVSEDRIRGWKDIPLSEEGRQDIKKNFPALKKLGMHGLVCSDLSRAFETAQIISRELKIPILEKTMSLRPWNLGVFAGQETKKVLPILQNYIKKQFKKVPQGESFHAFKKRFISYVVGLQKKFGPIKLGIVTHHRDERLMDAWLDYGEPEDVADIPSHPFMEKGIPPGGFTDYSVPRLDTKNAKILSKELA